MTLAKSNKPRWELHPQTPVTQKNQIGASTAASRYLIFFESVVPLNYTVCKFNLLFLSFTPKKVEKVVAKKFVVTIALESNRQHDTKERKSEQNLFER